MTLPAAIKIAVAERWAANAKMTVIADELGLTKNQVAGIVHRLGLHRRPGVRLAKKAQREAARAWPEARVAPVPVAAVPTPVPVETAPPDAHDESEPPRNVFVLPAKGCRFIEAPDFLARLDRGENIYCGAPVVGPEHAWCHTHRSRVYQPATPAKIRKAMVGV